MHGIRFSILGLAWLSTLAASPMPAPGVDEIIRAHGGREALQGIRTYAARLELTDIWVHQSPTPGPPWQTSGGTRCHVLDLSAGRFAGYERRTAAGFYPFHAARWLTPDGDRHFNLHDGWRRDREPGDAAGAIEDARRFAPALLVRAMAAGPEGVKATEPETGEHAPRTGYRLETVSGENVQLSFDDRTRMLREATFGDATIRYDGYEMVDGFPVSRRMEMDWRGEMVWRLHLAEAVFGGDFPAAPESLAALPAVPARNGPDPRRFRVHTLDPGVYLVGEGVRYQLFVEFRDFVVALGAVGGVKKRLDAVRALTEDKPLRYALVTHHHGDHLEGIPALVDAGAVIVASPAHASVVRAAAGAGREPRLALVPERAEITDGNRSLVFRELGPMGHSEHMLGALLPAERILFAADLFVQPPDRPLRAGIPPIRDLLAAVERLGLEALRFVDPHSPVVPNLADLRLAAGKPGDMTGHDAVEDAVCPP